ncbi:hypothetical protein C8034_v004262 [Colletotrichum sidae]|uniref:Uncharacterized protein n=1 Tax=Colletotrichum sidae TaxID=1347389 RepID=A0A4V6QFS2_9PEZI|nr:hypothetical protein C8034_v004262 [Colletotrichum sidae]
MSSSQSSTPYTIPYTGTSGQHTAQGIVPASQQPTMANPAAAPQMGPQSPYQQPTAALTVASAGNIAAQGLDTPATFGSQNGPSDNIPSRFASASAAASGGGIVSGQPSASQSHGSSSEAGPSQTASVLGDHTGGRALSKRARRRARNRNQGSNSGDQAESASLPESASQTQSEAASQTQASNNSQQGQAEQPARRVRFQLPQSQLAQGLRQNLATSNLLERSARSSRMFGTRTRSPIQGPVDPSSGSLDELRRRVERAREILARLDEINCLVNAPSTPSAPSDRVQDSQVTYSRINDHIHSLEAKMARLTQTANELRGIRGQHDFIMGYVVRLNNCLRNIDPAICDKLPEDVASILEDIQDQWITEEYTRAFAGDESDSELSEQTAGRTTPGHSSQGSGQSTPASSAASTTTPGQGYLPIIQLPDPTLSVNTWSAQALASAPQGNSVRSYPHGSGLTHSAQSYYGPHAPQAMIPQVVAAPLHSNPSARNTGVIHHAGLGNTSSAWPMPYARPSFSGMNLSAPSVPSHPTVGHGIYPQGSLNNNSAYAVAPFVTQPEMHINSRMAHAHAARYGTGMGVTGDMGIYSAYGPVGGNRPRVPPGMGSTANASFLTAGHGVASGYTGGTYGPSGDDGTGI